MVILQSRFSFRNVSRLINRNLKEDENRIHLALDRGLGGVPSEHGSDLLGPLKCEIS